MSYRDALPQLSSDRPFITDGGLETTLIFIEGMDLPSFAAFPLLADDEGSRALRAYYDPYVEIARDRGVGAVLETPTWRANPDWAEQLGYSPEQLDEANRRSVALVEEVRAANEDAGVPIVISGCHGPRGDGYVVGELMSAEEAEQYHSAQVASFKEAGADLVTAITMTYAEEAIGIVRAAVAAEMPVVISFTVETDGRLPSGQPLKDAIEQVDEATGGAAAYFMVNCAHPTHFAGVLDEEGAWRDRIGGLRANASTMSHAELDEAEELDDGDPAELGAQHRDLLHGRLPNVKVLGGCCGTDHRHVAEISGAWPSG